MSAHEEPSLQFLLALAREVYAQANGPTAWGKLTDAGRHLYAERMRACWVAVTEPKPALPITEDDPELVIVIGGGMLEEVYGFGLPPNIPFVIADKDGDCESRLVIHRPAKAPHKRPPAPLTIRCDLGDGTVQPMSRESEVTL